MNEDIWNSAVTKKIVKQIKTTFYIFQILHRICALLTTSIPVL